MKMKNTIYISDRRVKIIKNTVMSIAVAGIILYVAIYLFTMHPTGSESWEYLKESEGWKVENQEVNEKTGLIEDIGEGGGRNTKMRGCVLTIEGELRSGSFHYELYAETGDRIFTIDLEPGEYNEEYYIGYIGYSYKIFKSYPPETRGELYFDFTHNAYGYELLFTDFRP